MAWVTVTQADVEMYVVSALLTAINEAALGDAQADRFTTVHSDTIAEVRAAVGSCDENVLDSDTTKIPQSLRSAACWLIANYMAQGLGVPLDEQQANEVAAARAKLEAVARCDFAVEEADDGDIEPDFQTGGALEMVTPQERSYTRETMAGL